MRVLLYEHISSGGYAGKPIPTSMLCEGFAMLRGLAIDFKGSGHDVTALLDARLAATNPPLSAGNIVQIASSKDVFTAIEKEAINADAVYAVAPEAGHELESIVEVIATSGTPSLNCPPDGIKRAADKAALKERAKRIGFNFPKTEVFKASSDVKKTSEVIKERIGEFPFVVKPLLSAGCEGLSVAWNEKQLERAIHKTKDIAINCPFVVQELISGIPVSVSLICTGKKALPVSLNLQKITLGSGTDFSSYDGGAVPFDHELKEEVFIAAKKLVESFENLGGYIGVDFVLSGDRVFVMEVNPRLTTSYVALREVAKLNLAEAAMRAILEKQLPVNPEIFGFSYFTKIPVSSVPTLAWPYICRLEGVAAPPFPLDDNKEFHALISSFGCTIEEAALGVSQTRNRLMQLCQGGEPAK